ncbi:hypothetical protein [Laceyella putida]|uniref:Uncharacterized protein n=1 Tax=Laceyella putida TaxID=110101 RepID=A0ABW2RL65_9BACL
MFEKKSVILIGLAFFVILLLVNNFGPYNVLSALTANNLSDYEEIQQRLDGKIVNIKYIGKNAYQTRLKRIIFLLKTTAMRLF